jgi:hypothetical protein
LGRGKEKMRPAKALATQKGGKETKLCPPLKNKEAK